MAVWCCCDESTMARLSLLSLDNNEDAAAVMMVGDVGCTTETDVTVTKSIIDESSFVVVAICVVLLLLLDNVVSCCCSWWWCDDGDTDVGSDGVSLAAVVVGELGVLLQFESSSSSSLLLLPPESDPSVSMLALRSLRVDDVAAFSAGADDEPPRQGRQQRNSVGAL